MTVRLTVDRTAWLAHVRATAAAYGDGLVPVVKGNGYGFGRPVLHRQVAELTTDAPTPPAGEGLVCVGTVHELHDVPSELTAVVLTPTLTVPVDERAILTVGSVAHVRAVGGWHGRVIVKLVSSMRRYGATPAELPELLGAVEAGGLQPHAFGLHLPLVGDDDERLSEIEAWLPLLDPSMPLWISHLSAGSFAALRRAHPTRELRTRVGTALWHGVPRGSFVRLSAEVLDARPVRAGDTVGYFHSVAPHDGTLLAIGAGSAHGIAPLVAPDPTRRSPFHFGGQRLTLVERPHMHTSLVIAPTGRPCPAVGAHIDVQRPLITTAIDELEWS